MNIIQWVWGGKRMVVVDILVYENGHVPYGKVYRGVSRRIDHDGNVLEARYPDGIVLKRNLIRALLNKDFRRVARYSRSEVQS